MPGFDYSQIPGEKLVEVFSRSLTTIDGLWFLAIEQKYGFDAAMEMDIEVWRRFSSIHGRRVIRTFTIKEDTPVRTLIKLVQADPLMAVQKPEVVTLTDDKAIFRCMDCPTQVARIKDGKGVFPGQPVCQAMYTAYAEAIDPRIKITCLASPPDTENVPYWCEWQFEIPD